jgi:hypothetical protein
MVEGMENPYRDLTAPAESNDPQAPKPPRSGIVSQVRIVALLMGIQGVLEVVFGLMLGCVGGAFPLMSSLMESSGERVPYDDTFITFGFVFYLAMAVVHLSVGILHLYAAALTYRFRGRKWGIAALITGLLTAIMLFCLPTALGLAVYGLVVYVNEAVIRAFEMGQRGEPPTDILAACGPGADN